MQNKKFSYYDSVIAATNLQKTAKPSWYNTNFRRWLGERMFSGFGQKMKRLRKVNEITSAWADTLEPELKAAKSFSREGILPHMLGSLSRLEKALRSIGETHKLLLDNVSVSSGDFDRPDNITDAEIPDKYFGLESDRIDPVELDAADDGFIANAGIKERAGEYIQSLFDKQLRDRRLATKQLLSEAEATVKQVKRILDKMDDYLIAGDINSYIDQTKLIADRAKAFSESCNSKYEKHFKNEVERQRAKAKGTVPDVPLSFSDLGTQPSRSAEPAAGAETAGAEAPPWPPVPPVPPVPVVEPPWPPAPVVEPPWPPVDVLVDWPAPPWPPAPPWVVPREPATRSGPQAPASTDDADNSRKIAELADKLSAAERKKDELQRLVDKLQSEGKEKEAEEAARRVAAAEEASDSASKELSDAQAGSSRAAINNAVKDVLDARVQVADAKTEEDRAKAEQDLRIKQEAAEAARIKKQEEDQKAEELKKFRLSVVAVENEIKRDAETKLNKDFPDYLRKLFVVTEFIQKIDERVKEVNQSNIDEDLKTQFLAYLANRKSESETSQRGHAGTFSSMITRYPNEDGATVRRFESMKGSTEYKVIELAKRLAGKSTTSIPAASSNNQGENITSDDIGKIFGNTNNLNQYIALTSNSLKIVIKNFLVDNGVKNINLNRVTDAYKNRFELYLKEELDRSAGERAKNKNKEIIAELRKEVNENILNSIDAYISEVLAPLVVSEISKAKRTNKKPEKVVKIPPIELSGVKTNVSPTTNDPVANEPSAPSAGPTPTAAPVSENTSSAGGKINFNTIGADLNGLAFHFAKNIEAIGSSMFLWIELVNSDADIKSLKNSFQEFSKSYGYKLKKDMLERLKVNVESDEALGLINKSIGAITSARKEGKNKLPPPLNQQIINNTLSELERFIPADELLKRYFDFTLDKATEQLENNLIPSQDISDAKFKEILLWFNNQSDKIKNKKIEDSVQDKGATLNRLEKRELPNMGIDPVPPGERFTMEEDPDYRHYIESEFGEDPMFDSAAEDVARDLAREEARRAKQQSSSPPQPSAKANFGLSEDQMAEVARRTEESRARLQAAQEAAKRKHQELVGTPKPEIQPPQAQAVGAEIRTEHKPAAERGGFAEQLQGVRPADAPKVVAPGVVKRKRGKGKQSSHQNFYNELVKASSVNDPYLLATMLVRYSSQIEDDDFDTSMKLLAIAEGILDK